MVTLGKLRVNLIHLSQITTRLSRIMVKSAKSQKKINLQQNSECLVHKFYSSPEMFTLMPAAKVVTFIMSESIARQHPFIWKTAPKVM